MSASFTIIACIDRYILSSRKTKRWQFSRQFIAIRCILFIIIFWFIVSIPIAFCFTHINHSSHNEQLICSNQSQYMPCFLIQIFYICFFNGFIPPISMMYFGLLTSINARHLRQRYLSNSFTIERINYQFTSSFTSLRFSIFNCYLLITLNIQKSLLYQARENLIHQIIYLIFWSNYTSFFIYFYSSDIFRYQCLTTIKKLICCIHNDKQKHFNQQIE